jgi:hypothetical protein
LKPQKRRSFILLKKLKHTSISMPLIRDMAYSAETGNGIRRSLHSYGGGTLTVIKGERYEAKERSGRPAQRRRIVTLKYASIAS